MIALVLGLVRTDRPDMNVQYPFFYKDLTLIYSIPLNDVEFPFNDVEPLCVFLNKRISQNMF